MMALKLFLINDIYDLRQDLAQIQSKEKQGRKHRSDNERSIYELDIKLPHLQKENQTLRDDHISKRSITQTVLNQNNELLKLVNFQQITEKDPLKEN